MEYSITYIPEGDYILVDILGEIDVPTMEEAIQAAGPLIVEHQCNRVLGDFRKASLPVDILGLIELYRYWIKTLHNNKLSPYEAKRVILLSPDQNAMDKFRFFETFSNNRNSRVNLFFDTDQAVDWLTGVK